VVLGVGEHPPDLAHRLAVEPSEQLTASSTEAAVTSTASSKPMRSTTICRFRPSTFLALSRPLCSPPEVMSTDWLSTLAVVRGW
jgi:hypothetical protein